MSIDRSFAPLYTPSARVLILGSLPGKRSIAQQGYYAHPRNLFWSLIAELSGVPREADYEARIAGLLSLDVALWDVAQEAHRPGSLDSAIKTQSVIYNDIPDLLARCSQVDTILFNGTTAETLFKRAVRAWGVEPSCQRIALPSTSPANASLSYEYKRTRWLTALNEALGRRI